MTQRKFSSKGQRGIATIETLLALFPLLFLFLGIIQLAFFQIGRLVVQHAATRAARSAIVVLDDDPQFYNGAPRGNLISEGTEEDEGGFGSQLQELNAEYAALLQEHSVPAGARLKALRAPAYHALAVLASMPGEGGLSGSVLRLAYGRFVYAPLLSSITLHRSSDGPAIEQTAKKEDLIVKVSFLMPCNIPMVSALMCTSAAEITKATGEGTEFGKVVSRQPASDSAKEIVAALSGSSSPLLRDGLVALGSHFILLQAEAHFTAQGANYHLPEEE